jgi:hypothetical protein
MKLAEEHGAEACVSKTASYEYWDEMPSPTKIESMAEYLQDVSIDFVVILGKYLVQSRQEAYSKAVSNSCKVRDSRRMSFRSYIHHNHG